MQLLSIHLGSLAQAVSSESMRGIFLNEYVRLRGSSSYPASRQNKYKYLYEAMRGNHETQHFKHI